MSTSNATPKEEQTAYQRWEMSAFTAEDTQQPFNHQKTKTVKGQTSALNGALEGVRKEAYTKGVQEGFAVGMAQAKEHAEQERAVFQSIAANFTHALETADQGVEQDILNLALDIAKSMLKQKIAVDETLILPVVRDAMKHLTDMNKPATIMVHPEDARILREYMQEELAEQPWHIHEDPAIERGGCAVETGDNQIDASNATRWKRITEALGQNNDWMMTDG